MVGRVQGKRKRRLVVGVGGFVDRYGLEILEDSVKECLKEVGWRREGWRGWKWVFLEGLGGRKVKEVERRNGDAGVLWDNAWRSHQGRGWVE